MRLCKGGRAIGRKEWEQRRLCRLWWHQRLARERRLTQGDSREAIEDIDVDEVGDSAGLPVTVSERVVATGVERVVLLRCSLLLIMLMPQRVRVVGSSHVPHR